MKKRTLTLVIALVLVAVCAVGGTLAWLMDTDTVTNTFTVGNVDISLTESDADGDGNNKANSYKMIDPVIGVFPVREHAPAAVLDTVSGKSTVTAAFISQCIQRAIAEKTVKILRVICRMTGKVFTFSVAEKFIFIAHFSVPPVV